MGGFSFRTDLQNDNWELDELNLPMRNIWINALEAADELAIINNAKCPYDEDGKCSENGCLQESRRGWEMSLKGFLMANERVLAFIKANPEKVPEYQTVYSEILEGNEYEPGAELALPIIENLISRAKVCIEQGAKTVLMLDRLSDPDLYPCPRFHMLKTGPRTLSESKIIPYPEAKTKKENGEWEQQEKQFWNNLWAKDKDTSTQPEDPEDLPF